MRVPQTRMFAGWFSSIGLLCAGSVIGAAIFMVIYQHNMTELMKQNALLKEERDQLMDEIEPLKTYRDYESTLKSIEVQIESLPSRNAPDELVQSQIKKNVHEQLKPLIGIKVANLYDHPKQIINYFGRRILPNINEKDYIVEINTVVILYGKLHVWINVEERKE